MGETTDCREKRRQEYCAFPYTCSAKDYFEKDARVTLNGEVIYGICKEAPIF